MAGRDNVLFIAPVSSGTAAGTVVPLSLAYGIENVRQGYGTAKLKNIRAFYTGGYSTAANGIKVEVKNSNWIDSAGVVAASYGQETSLNKDNLCYMRGRDKVLQPNTSWTIAATIPSNTTSSMVIYALVEIEYSDVAGINAEAAAGSPVFKECKNSSVTLAANTYGSIGSFDNLLQGVQYVLSEVSALAPVSSTSPLFVILEGFSNQKGLTRIIPAKSTGLADQIEGSVILTKQTYNVGIISAGALSAAVVNIGFEMIASSN